MIFSDHLERKASIFGALCVVLFVLISVTAAKAEDLTVLPGSIGGVPPHDMMKSWLRGQADTKFRLWEDDFADLLLTPGEIPAYQQNMRDQVVEAIGGFPDSAPLNAQVVGTVDRGSFTVEKILFESQPNHHVTGAMFLPDPLVFPPPWPAVLVPCGHTYNGKAYDEYQIVPALCALNGMASFVFDPISQGERLQEVVQPGALA